MITQKDIFPDFVLDSHDTEKIRSERPLVVVVWRVGCPVCRMALPFFDRLQASYPEMIVLGVNQDPMGSRDEVQEYLQKNKIQFAQVFDSDLRVTRSLKMEVVPSFWLLGEGNQPLVAGRSWNKELMNEIARIVAQKLGIEPRELVTEKDAVPDFRPG
jgi:thiol-disulfide isomerase/thioredoxin